VGSWELIRTSRIMEGPRELLILTVRRFLPWYVVWLIDHPVILAVVVALVVLLGARLLASYASFLYRTVRVTLAVAFITSHIGAVWAAWLTLPADATIFDVGVSIFWALTLPTRMLGKTMMSPFTSVIQTARMVAGVVADPLLKIIGLQGRVIFGMARAIAIEIMQGYLILVVSLYYNCEANDIASKVLIMCKEVQSRAREQETKSGGNSTAEGKHKLKVQKHHSESWTARIVNMFSENRYLLGVAQIVANSQGKRSTLPILNLVCASGIGLALYPLRDVAIAAFAIHFVIGSLTPSNGLQRQAR